MNPDVWFKFLPASWRNDEGLRLCSLAARGLWIEILSLAHRTGGYLLINDAAPDAVTLARLVGSTPAEVKRLLAELRSNGVYSEREDGVIYSRRMVRDARRREVNRSNGARGGNPGLIASKSDNGPTPDSVGDSDNRSDNRSRDSVPESVNRKENSDNRNTTHARARSRAISFSFSSSQSDLELRDPENEETPVSSIPPVFRRRDDRASVSPPLHESYHTRNCAPWASAACHAGVCVPKFLWEQWERRQPSREALRAFVERVMREVPPAGDRLDRFWPAMFEREFGTAIPAGVSSRTPAAQVTVETMRRVW